jgi:uncharacterized iron-regulated membrane protein
VIGFWSAPVIILLTATGMVISYPWATNLLYTLTGSPRPVASARGGGAAAGGAADAQRHRAAARTETASPVAAASLESLVARAEERVPTWRSMIVRLPARPSAPVSFSMSDRNHWNSFARSTLTLASATGAEVSWEPYAGTSRGQKLRGWMRFAHTGELGGPVGEAVAGLASAGGAFLVWTGISLAIRRCAAWSARRRPSRALKTAA